MKRPCFHRAVRMLDSRGFPVGSGLREPDLDGGSIALMSKQLMILAEWDTCVVRFGGGNQCNPRHAEHAINSIAFTFPRTPKGWKAFGKYLDELKAKHFQDPY